MDNFTVTFFGHRRLYDHGLISDRLDKVILDILEKHENVDFLVGRNGDFDILAASAVRRCRTKRGDESCTLNLILPYFSREYSNNEEEFNRYYDSVELCKKANDVHFKNSIGIRNRIMVDRSDLVVCCVSAKSGGAYTAAKYAEGKRLPVINLA